jgi:hypothetical protein
MYVRRIQVKGQSYFQPVDAYRDGKRVHTQYLAPMGRHESPQAAAEDYEAELAWLRAIEQRTEGEEKRARKLTRWVRQLNRAVRAEVPAFGVGGRWRGG